MAEMDTAPPQVNRLEDSVDLKEFAAALGKDTSTVRRWLKDGKFESFLEDGKYRIPAREVNRVIAERGPKPVTAPTSSTGALVTADETYLGYAFGTLRSVRSQIGLIESFYDELKVTPIIFRDKAVIGVSGIKMTGFKALFNILRRERTKLLAICNSNYFDDDLLEVIKELCKELQVPLVNINGKVDQEREERLRSLENRIMK